MHLRKHRSGKPLSAAEVEQRRKAARARWKAGAVAGAATLIGGSIGADIGRHREAIRAQTAREHAREGSAIWQAQEIAREDRRILADAAARRDAIIEAIRQRMRPTPAPLPPGQRPARSEPLSAEALERLRVQAAAAEAAKKPFTPTQLEEMFGFELAGGPVPGPPAPPPLRPPRAPGPVPVVGSLDNPELVYDYAIRGRGVRGLGAHLRREQLVLRDVLAEHTDPQTGAIDDTHPTIRRQRARVAAITRDVERIEELRRRASLPTVRAGGDRQGRRGRVRVRAHDVHQYHGGETVRRVEERINRDRLDLRQQRDRLLGRLARRTARIRPEHTAAIIAQAEADLRTAIASGRFQARIMQASGKGAIWGAGIGLTSTGIGMLAHHVATAGRRKKTVQKSEGHYPGDIVPLAKADPNSTPENQIAKGVAETFRAWIDRLLGRNQAPMNLGDGLAEAMGPGITQAFAEGATAPPIVAPDHPNYRIDTDFDVLNPSVRRHMAEYALDRIVQISAAQREAIRSALMNQSVLQGIGPLEVARTIRESIGLTAYQQGVVQSFRVMLQQLDPRVLERKLRDRRYDKTIREAIRTNTPLTEAQINAMVDAYHRRALTLRAQTIARTEALRATSFGGLARAQQVLDEHPELDVTKRWLATDDERTRDTHVDLNGKEVDGMATHFITSKGNLIRWPLDTTAAADETINCRCTLQYIFKPKRGQLVAVAA